MLQAPAKPGLPQPWFGVSVRPRCEKVVEMVLANKGYEPYLPLHSTRRQRSDRVVEIDLPLFPGYLFCRFDPLRRRLPVITTPGVCGIVGLGNTPEAIPDEEIFAIQKMLRSGPSAEPWPYLRDGERVTVIRGSLTGLEGVLVRKKGQCRLVVSVSLLQRSVSVEIDQDSISPLR